MTDTDKAQAKARADLDRAATKATVAVQRANAARADRDAAIVSAQEAGLTYPQIAELAGVSYDRVKQVLADARRAQEG